MSTILETIKQKLTRKAATEAEQTATAFDRLVCSLADEKDPGAQTVADVLFRSGKTLDDLQADIARLLERRRLLTLLPGEQPAQAAIEQAAADLATAQAAFIEATKARTAAGELYGRTVSQARVTLKLAADARRDLIAGCRDKGAFDRWTVATAKVASLENQLSQQRSTLGDGSQGVIGALHRLPQDIDSAKRADLFKQASDMQAELDGYREAKPRIEQTIKRLEAELSGARQDLAAVETILCQP
ncbi:MAG TPA: hypothetical protein VHY91_16715 [Pirellulales bacterium]|nr:hypothetical protein [Pirellulales bacterium]